MDWFRSTAPARKGRADKAGKKDRCSDEKAAVYLQLPQTKTRMMIGLARETNRHRKREPASTIHARRVPRLLPATVLEQHKPGVSITDPRSTPASGRWCNHKRCASDTARVLLHKTNLTARSAKTSKGSQKSSRSPRFIKNPFRLSRLKNIINAN